MLTAAACSRGTSFSTQLLEETVLYCNGRLGVLNTMLNVHPSSSTLLIYVLHKCYFVLGRDFLIKLLSDLDLGRAKARTEIKASYKLGIICTEKETPDCWQ